MNINNLPLVTIITVVFNGEKFIEETIQSVINQTYKNIQYIIIDGGSSDGTVELIKKSTDKITYWISEPDRGIYDAMNKGIKIAKGEWLNFLNAGDTFVDNYVLEKIFSENLLNVTLIYGDIMVLKENGQTYHHRVSILNDSKSIITGMSVCHQAILYNEKIMHLYDSSLQLKAEWKHLIEITKNPFFLPYKINFPIVYYRTGGLSAKLLSLNYSEAKKVFLEKYGLILYLKYFPLFLWRFMKSNIKKSLIRIGII